MTDTEKKMLMFYIEQIEKHNKIIAGGELTNGKSPNQSYPAMFGALCGLCAVNTAIIQSRVDDLKKLIENS